MKKLRSLQLIAWLVGVLILASGCVTRLWSAEEQMLPGVSRLDPGGVYDYADPVWSPDGTRIAYTRYQVVSHPWSWREGSGEIFVMDLATRQVLQLTHNSMDDYLPHWAPDGQRLVYATKEISYPSQNSGPVYEYSLRIVNSDGSGDTALFACSAGCGWPDWSPAGDRIAFSESATRRAEGDDQRLLSEIYLINPDGTGLTRLTQGENDLIAPRWSPDGRRIVAENFTDHQIVIVDVPSGVETPVGPNPASQPVWSPDGTGIVFEGYEPVSQRFKLYYLNLGDQSVTPYFTASINDFDLLSVDGHPDWSPDVSELVLKAHLAVPPGLYQADLSILRPR